MLDVVFVYNAMISSRKKGQHFDDATVMSETN